MSANVGWTPEPWKLPDNLDMRAVADLPWGERLPLEEAINLLAFGERTVDRERWALNREYGTVVVAGWELFDMAAKGAVEVKALAVHDAAIDAAPVPAERFSETPMRPSLGNSFQPDGFLSPRHGDEAAQMEAEKRYRASPREWTDATVSVDGLRNWLEQKVAKRDGDEMPTERFSWPEKDMDGHHFIGEAIDRIGKCMFPDTWTGQERDGFRVTRPILAPPLPPVPTAPGSPEEGIVKRLLSISHAPTAEEWTRARRMQQELREGYARFKQAAVIIVEACQSGRVRAALTPQVKEPEVFVPCPISFWQASSGDMTLRAYFGRLNPSDPFRRDVTECMRPTYNWIFLRMADVWFLEEAVESEHQPATAPLPRNEVKPPVTVAAPLPEKPQAISATAPSEPTVKKKRIRATMYDWEAFDREAWTIIEDEGIPDAVVDPSWTQAGLERRMQAWCEKRWGKSPGESTIRERVVLVIKRYREAS